jgi:hypothetical protein
MKYPPTKFMLPTSFYDKSRADRQQSVRWMNMDVWDSCSAPVDEKALEGRVCYGGRVDELVGNATIIKNIMKSIYADNYRTCGVVGFCFSINVNFS